MIKQNQISEAVAVFQINTPGNESIPHISPDGKYLFYTSNRDIFWVDTGFIEELKPGQID